MTKKYANEFGYESILKIGLKHENGKIKCVQAFRAKVSNSNNNRKGVRVTHKYFILIWSVKQNNTI